MKNCTMKRIDEKGIDAALDDETPECDRCGKKMALWTDSGKRTWVCLDLIAGKCKSADQQGSVVSYSTDKLKETRVRRRYR